jgi:hypothetical protein
VPLQEAVDTFKRNAASVFGLIDFDRAVLEFAIDSLNNLVGQLEALGSNNASRTVGNFVQVLGNVRQNDSLRPKYETIYNQCVVLLVSYFGAAVHTVFTEAIGTAFAGAHSVPAASHEVKLTWRDLRRDDLPLGEVLAELIVAQRDISFQDMQSITRAFKDNLAVELDRDIVTNDIILGQACRHAIAHAGRVADARMIRQLRAAVPRSLKQTITEGDAISFAPDEVLQLGATMEIYLVRLCEAVETRLNRSTNAV